MQLERRSGDRTASTKLKAATTAEFGPICAVRPSASSTDDERCLLRDLTPEARARVISRPTRSWPAIHTSVTLRRPAPTPVEEERKNGEGQSHLDELYRLSSGVRGRDL